MGPAFLHDLRCQHFHRESKSLLHADCYLCMLPEPGEFVLAARLPYRNGVRRFIEKEVPVLAHNGLLSDIWRALQKLMEVTVPPLTVLHASYRLFGAELRWNTSRRAAGRTIAQLGFLQDGHAISTLRQSNGNKRTR